MSEDSGHGAAGQNGEVNDAWEALIAGGDSAGAPPEALVIVPELIARESTARRRQ